MSTVIEQNKEKSEIDKYNKMEQTFCFLYQWY